MSEWDTAPTHYASNANERPHKLCTAHGHVADVLPEIDAAWLLAAIEVPPGPKAWNK